MTKSPEHKTLPLSKKDTAPKLFYGYIIVLAALISLVLIGGLQFSFGIFLKEIQTETHWNRATISGASSLAFFLMGLFAIISGRLVDKYGPRLVMTISGIIIGIGFILVSRVSQIWQLYAAYGIIIGIGLSSSDVTMMSTTARWFTKNRGLMTSIIKTGNGLGMFVIPLLSGWLILQSDWRMAYIVLAIIAIVVIAGAAQFLKHDPSQIGQHPYGAAAVTAKNQLLNQRDFTFREVCHSHKFWLVCGVYFLTWWVVQSVITHFAVHLEDGGLTVAQAAGIMATIGVVSIAGRLAMGALGDRIGNRRALIICCIFLFASTIWLQFIQGQGRAYIFAVIYGFAHGGYFAILSPLMAELFGLKSHGANLGMLFFIGQTGGAIGPIITGRIYDTQQSYQLAFYILLGAAAMGLLLSLLLGRSSKPALLRT